MADIELTTAVQPGIRYTFLIFGNEGDTNTRSKIDGTLRFFGASDVRFLKAADTPQELKGAILAVPLPTSKATRWVVSATFSKKNELPKSPSGDFTINRILSTVREETLAQRIMPFLVVGGIVVAGWKWWQFTHPRAQK